MEKQKAVEAQKIIPRYNRVIIFYIQAHVPIRSQPNSNDNNETLKSSGFSWPLMPKNVFYVKITNFWHYLYLVIILGERYVYKFVCDPEALFNMAYGNNCDNHNKPQLGNRPEDLSTKTEHHHLPYTEMFNFYNCGISHSYQHLPGYTQDTRHSRYT